MSVNIEKFGKDHWSLLGYVEYCCVENKGFLDKAKMRGNENTHPLLSNNFTKWKETYGTKLKDFDYKKEFNPKEFEQNGTYLSTHDDWDCLDDLEKNGLIEVISLAQMNVQMTEYGLLMAGKLRAHKSNGGMFANFNYLDEIKLNNKVKL